jgi:hypothetical protein
MSENIKATHDYVGNGRWYPKSLFKDMVSGAFSTAVTSTPEKESLTLEKIQKVAKLLKATPIRKFYASNAMLPDDLFKITKDAIPKLDFNLDKNVDELYICGSNVRDALIETGIIFENYNPEKEK